MPLVVIMLGAIWSKLNNGAVVASIVSPVAVKVFNESTSSVSAITVEFESCPRASKAKIAKRYFPGFNLTRAAVSVVVQIAVKTCPGSLMTNPRYLIVFGAKKVSWDGDHATSTWEELVVPPYLRRKLVTGEGASLSYETVN